MKPSDPAQIQSIKIIGLGGVGSIAARYGAMYLAAWPAGARLTLIDGDSFEPSNATRQFFGECGNKAQVVRKELLPRFREGRLTILADPQYVSEANLPRLIRERDIVLMCVDNHATRKLVNGHCRSLAEVALISGGNDGLEKGRPGTYGNVQIYLRREGRDLSPCLARFHPEIENPKDKLPGDLSCVGLIQSVPQILFTNLAVASIMLSSLRLVLEGRLPYAEACFDIGRGRMWPALDFKPTTHEPAD